MIRHNEIKSELLLRILIIFCIVLSISVFFLYHTRSWPAGIEPLGCLAAAVSLVFLLLALILGKNRFFSESDWGYLTTGLFIGLLWTAEISINNIICPDVPLRDRIDDSFWALIAFLILLNSVRASFSSNSFMGSVRAVSGLVSAAVLLLAPQLCCLMCRA